MWALNRNSNSNVGNLDTLARRNRVKVRDRVLQVTRMCFMHLWGGFRAACLNT